MDRPRIFKFGSNIENPSNFLVLWDGSKNFFLFHKENKKCKRLITLDDIEKVLREEKVKKCDLHGQIDTKFGVNFNNWSEIWSRGEFFVYADEFYKTHAPSFIDFVYLVHVLKFDPNYQNKDKIIKIEYPKSFDGIERLHDALVTFLQEQIRGIYLTPEQKNHFIYSVLKAFFDEMTAAENGYVTFYTGRSSVFSLFSVIRRIYKKEFAIDLNPVSNPGSQNSAFLRALQQGVGGKYDPINDETAGFSERFVSCNISLFGNFTEHGEQTLFYYLRGHSEIFSRNPIDLKIFEEFIAKEFNGKKCPGIDEKILEYYKKEIRSESPNLPGELIAIRLPINSNELIKYVYPSHAWGQPNKRYNDVRQFIATHMIRSTQITPRTFVLYNQEQGRLFDLQYKADDNIIVERYGGFAESPELDKKIGDILKECMGI